MYNIDNYVCTGLIFTNLKWKNMYDEQSLLLVKEIAVFVEHHIDLKYIYIYINTYT